MKNYFFFLKKNSQKRYNSKRNISKNIFKMERHETNRKSLCVICCASAKRLLTSRMVSVVQDYLIEGYTMDNPRLPCGVCLTCQVTLCSLANGDFFTVFKSIL